MLLFSEGSSDCVLGQGAQRKWQRRRDYAQGQLYTV